MLSKLKRKKGQSTLEYIILVTAVIVIVIGLLVSPASPFRTQLNTTFNGAIDKINIATTYYANQVQP
jgi:uncharacterized protein (UPF0333 family)